MDAGEVNHDSFCWRCLAGDCSLKCDNCVRVFHRDCIELTEASSNDGTSWWCPACIYVEMNANRKIETVSLLIQLMMQRVNRNRLFVKLNKLDYTKSEQCVQLVNPMDLKSIVRKQRTYKSFAELRYDAQWIWHNCVIAFGDDHEKTKLAKRFVAYLSAEIDGIEKCDECYQNAVQHPNDWFTMACHPPHIIVWAKATGFDFWPAKIMSIDGQCVNVRFFGDHTHSDVLAMNCRLYTINNPYKLANDSKLITALKEADQYLDVLRHTFGTIKLPDTEIIFNPDLYGQYFADMFCNGIRLQEPTEINSESESSFHGFEPLQSGNTGNVHQAIDKHAVVLLHRIDTSIQPSKKKCCLDPIASDENMLYNHQTVSDGESDAGSSSSKANSLTVTGDAAMIDSSVGFVMEAMEKHKFNVNTRLNTVMSEFQQRIEHVFYEEIGNTTQDVVQQFKVENNANPGHVLSVRTKAEMKQGVSEPRQS